MADKSQDQAMKALMGAGLSSMAIAAIASMLSGKEDLDPEKGRIAEVSEASGETIQIPKGMSKLAASEELRRQYKEEETEIDFMHQFKKWDWRDALVSLNRQLKETFGWVNAKAQMSFFGKQNPVEIQLPVGLDDDGVIISEPGFLGDFAVTAWEDALGTVGVGRDGRAIVKLTIKKKFKERATAFFDACEKRLVTNSIYKGKSVVFDEIEGQLGFAFFRNKANPHIMLNKEEELMLSNLVIAPLVKRAKRTILFTGDYGTGKTESAMRVGEAGNLQGITFIYCKKSEHFTELLALATQYQPCILFMEDIDEAGGGEDRDSKMNDLLNTLDGVQTKQRAITTLFTTNHEDRINKALRRPGRIDVIVKFNACEPETVERIYLDRFQELPGGAQLDYKKLVALTPKAQGAVIAEICNRAIDTAEAVKDGFMTDDIVETAIASSKVTLDFMKKDPEDNSNKVTSALAVLGSLLTGPLKEKLAESFDTLDERGYADAAKTLRS